MKLVVEDKYCWICGVKKRLTMHHALPKWFKPRHNVLIPLCEKCHERLNTTSVSNLYAFVVSMENKIRILKEMFQNFFKHPKGENK